MELAWVLIIKNKVIDLLKHILIYFFFFSGCGAGQQQRLGHNGYVSKHTHTHVCVSCPDCFSKTALKDLQR